MSDQHALRSLRRILSRLADEFENAFGDRSSGNARGGGFSSPNSEIIELTLHQSSAPAEINSVDLHVARAIRNRELRKETAKHFHISRIFAARLAIVRVVMPAVNVDDEQHWSRGLANFARGFSKLAPIPKIPALIELNEG